MNKMDEDRNSQNVYQTWLKTFSGFMNFQTGVVLSRITKSENSHCYWRQQTERHCKAAALDGHDHPYEFAKMNLADQLQEEINGNSPLTEESLYTDLLNEALTAVEWEQIADKLLAYSGLMEPEEA
jgi:hypothetical protein